MATKQGSTSRNARDNGAPPKVALALAGGGPLGAMYEIGVLMALDESIDGLDLNGMDVYVGVSAGSFITAALANGITPSEIYRLFIENEAVDGAKLKPELFLKPAFKEYFRRAKSLPGLVAEGIYRFATKPFSRGPVDAFAGLSRAIPTGIFDNEAISRFLNRTFSLPGRTNDFRKLKARLYSVATDLDTGQSVSFGGPGFDHVPISKAVQASAALPGLFPPVRIEGHYYVDGALKKTLHASVALEDGAEMVICINPLVPFDADSARRRGKPDMEKLVEGGLPVVLSQTFRAIIHSRMQIGLSKYDTKYKGADVVLFEPNSDDPEMFFTNLFSYSTRQRVCEHAYQRTRHDLLKRRFELAPIFARYGMTLNVDVLKDETRTLDAKVQRSRPRKTRSDRLRGAMLDLSDAVVELQGLIARRKAS
ncbi:MAG: patatin-like phospholipase family protein [Burkholderiales bacterium]|nr:patatin-like phospholipase family protein [Burkholderiales bacterium]